jgi:hypothetical protein
MIFFLLVQLSHVAKPSQSKFSFLQDYSNDHGVISLDVHDVNNIEAAPVDASSSSAAAKPCPKLTRVLSMVPECKSEEDIAEDEAGREEPQDAEDLNVSLGASASGNIFSTTITDDDTDNNDYSASASLPLPLESFACQGLLPRPDGCSHLFNYQNKSGITAVHLDRVPFTVRPATIDDAAALHRLQGHLPDKALHSRLSLKTIQKLLKKDHAKKTNRSSSWQWLAEVEGSLVAAVLLGHSGKNHVTAALEFKLVAVHPALEERAEVLFALLNFVVQLLTADPSIHELRQGNLNISGLQEEKSSNGNVGFEFETAASNRLTDKGSDGVVARFASTVLSPGKSDTSKELNTSSPSSLPSLQMKTERGSRKSSSSCSINQREAVFTAGISLDDIAWIIGQVTSVTKLKSSYYNNGRKSGDSAETTPEKHMFSKIFKEEEGGRHRKTTDTASTAGRRRSKLVSIVEEARRLTSSAGFNDPGKYSCILFFI